MHRMQLFSGDTIIVLYSGTDFLFLDCSLPLLNRESCEECRYEHVPTKWWNAETQQCLGENNVDCFKVKLLCNDLCNTEIGIWHEVFKCYYDFLEQLNK